MGYKMIKLSKLCEISSGGTPSRKNKNFYGGVIPWLKISDLNIKGKVVYKSEETITQEGLKAIRNKLFKKGTLLFAMYGSIGKTAFAGVDLTTNQAILGINAINNNKLYIEYLDYWFKFKLNFLNNLGRGVAQKNLSATIIRNLEIPLPLMDVQIKIANALDKAQELIDNRKAQIEKYDELLLSVFLDMFGDPVTNSKRWDSQELKEISDITSGVTKGKKNKEETFEVPYMRVANVQDGHINLDNIKMISVSKKDYEKFLLKKNDILLTEGGDPDKLGRGAVWYEEVKNCIHQNHIFRVRVDQGEINSEYLSRLIGSIYGKRYFLKIAKQTTGIATINKTQLSKFPVLLPPLELQNQFAEIVEKVEIEKKKIKDSLVELENNFNSIMQMAFRGELF